MSIADRRPSPVSLEVLSETLVFGEFQVLGWTELVNTSNEKLKLPEESASHHFLSLLSVFQVEWNIQNLMRDDALRYGAKLLRDEIQPRTWGGVDVDLSKEKTLVAIYNYRRLNDRGVTHLKRVLAYVRKSLHLIDRIDWDLWKEEQVTDRIAKIMGQQS